MTDSASETMALYTLQLSIFVYLETLSLYSVIIINDRQI